MPQIFPEEGFVPRDEGWLETSPWSQDSEYLYTFVALQDSNPGYNNPILRSQWPSLDLVFQHHQILRLIYLKVLFKVSCLANPSPSATHLAVCKFTLHYHFSLRGSIFFWCFDWKPELFQHIGPGTFYDASDEWGSPEQAPNLDGMIHGLRCTSQTPDISLTCCQKDWTCSASLLASLTQRD